MKSSSLLVLSSALLLCACQGEKSYTITGTLDLPAQIPYGDTIVDVPSFNDTWVYLIDLDYQKVDSALIEDNGFYFEGKVKQNDAFFVYLVSQLGQSILVVEPGDIEVYINPDITVSGTPSNDCMTDLESSLTNLNNDTYTYLADLTDSLSAVGEEVSEEQQQQIAEGYRTTMINLLDSAYEANKDNQGGAYAVLMRLMDAETVDDFETALERYPETIRNSQLIQLTLRQMREYEQMDQGSGLEDLDPSMFAPAEDEPQSDN